MICQYMKSIFLIMLTLTFVSCASVETFVKENNYRGAREFCEKKADEKQKEACFAEVAELARETRPSKSYSLFMELGQKTNDSNYYNRAGEIAYTRLDTMKALTAYEAAENIEAVKTVLRDRSQKSDSTYVVTHASNLAKYAEKYQMPDVFGNLAVLVENSDEKKAAVYYEKAGQLDRARAIYLQLGKAAVKKKYYSTAGGYFIKAGDFIQARSAYLVAAEKSLNARNPNFKDALRFYKKADAEEEGKRKVATLMIKKRNVKEGVKLAETVDKAFYIESLLLAGDVHVGKNEFTARKYYEKAGVKDTNERIAMAYLNQKKPSFYSADKYFKKSDVKNYESRMLVRAIELNDTNQIKIYSRGASGPDMHEKVGFVALESGKFHDAYSHFRQSNKKDGAGLIAKKAEEKNQKAIAAQYYYLDGQETKAKSLWDEYVQITIKNQTFLRNYLVLVDPPDELKDIYLNDILDYFQTYWKIFAIVPTQLKINQPLLALGFVHNQHRADYFMKVSQTYLEGDSAFSISAGEKARQNAAIYIQFNKLLTTLVTDRAVDTSKYDAGFKELTQAQVALLNRKFRNVETHIGKARELFAL